MVKNHALASFSANQADSFHISIICPRLPPNSGRDGSGLIAQIANTHNTNSITGTADGQVGKYSESTPPAKQVT